MEQKLKIAKCTILQHLKYMGQLAPIKSDTMTKIWHVNLGLKDRIHKPLIYDLNYLIYFELDGLWRLF